MEEQPELRSYHQSRWICLIDGFFDIRLEKKPPKKYRPRCPECKRQAEPRKGFECTGKTSGPIPFISKPRLAETPEIEVAMFDNRKVLKNRKGYYDRHKRGWVTA